MPNRNGTVSGAEYRYAFNGMETDKEVSGNGNSYTTQFRQYDPRLGRWKSLDPLAGKFPNMSPFVAFNDNPIYFVDPLGLVAEGSDKTDAGGDEPKDGTIVTVHFTSGTRDYVYNSATGNWEYYEVENGKKILKHSYPHSSLKNSNDPEDQQDKFSSNALYSELDNLFKALDEGDKSEAIFSAGEVLYQAGLYTNEVGNEYPLAEAVGIYMINQPIDLIAYVVDRYVDNIQQAGWYDLIMIYMFELSEDVKIDDPNSPATKDLSNHKGVSDARSEAFDKGQKLKVGESTKGKSTFHYHLNNMNKNIEEMKTGDPRQVNALELFLGSYQVVYTVTRISDTELLFEWEVTNTSGLESATRFRRKNGTNVNGGILKNKNRGSGIHIGGTFTQIFVGSEIIKIE